MELEAYACAEKQSGSSELLFRIEHAKVLAEEDLKKLRELGVPAAMQANHLLTDMNWAEERIGAKRAEHSYPWKEFLFYGIPVAFGTDYPVEPITPFRGLYAAITRRNEAGTKEYVPIQQLNINEAIAAYTTTPATLKFREEVKITPAPGMLADFIVLDRDIVKNKPEEIP